MVENKVINVPYLNDKVCTFRILASWLNVGGDTFEATLNDEGEAEYAFLVWLKALGISEEDARDIWNTITCGKLELEMAAKKFRKNHEVLDY